MPVWVTTTHLGLPLPPITDWHTPHLPPGLVPHAPYSPITLGDPKVDSRMRTHTHAHLIGAPSTHFLVDFYRLPVHNGWGAAIIPFCGGPMLHTLHVHPIPTTFLLAYAGILFTHG